MENILEEIEKYLAESTNRSKYYNLKFQPFWKRAEELYPVLFSTFTSLQQIVWHIRNPNEPLSFICPTCNINKRKWARYDYTPTCSNQCHITRTLSAKMKTNQKKYGGNSPACSSTVIDKMKESTKNHFGVENASQAQVIKDKKKQKSIDIYGVDNPSKAQVVKDAISDAYYAKTDEERLEIKEKQMRKSVSYKEYEMPSGNIIEIQGFENFAIDELLTSGIDETDILTGRNNGVRIHPVVNGEEKLHYPDIHIPSKNLVIEVKSSFTYGGGHLELNLAKKAAALAAGYNYEFWLYDNKGRKEVR